MSVQNAKERLDTLNEATDEADRNLGEVENKPSQMTIDYLRGDAAEIEAQAEKACGELRKIADEAEAGLEAVADQNVGGDGPPALKAKFDI